MEKLPFAYPIDHFSRHVLVAGRTGVGKTNLLMLIILSMMAEGATVWVWDYLKTDYRHLRRLCPDLRVWNSETLIFNPWQPPAHVDPRLWINLTVSVFCKVNSLLDASRRLLVSVLTKLYRDLGVFDGSLNYPSSTMVSEAVWAENTKGQPRLNQAKDSVHNRMRASLLANPEVHAYSHGFPVEELAKHSAVFELKAMDEMDAAFRILAVNYALFQQRIETHDRGQGLKTLSVIDEAHSIVPDRRNDAIPFSPAAALVSQARETGLGFVFSSQSTDLDQHIVRNTALKIAFALGDGAEIERVQKAFSLSREQAAYINRLQTGEAIVRAPWNIDPFVIRVPRVPLE